MDRYLFIINPIAGHGRSKLAEDTINSKMKLAGKNYAIIQTNKPNEAQRVVIENKDKYDVFVAVGGDGTINEVATGIAKAGRGALGIIALGTGNDLARALDIRIKDVEAALDILIRGRVGKMDVLKANGSYFFNIASIGYDAEVIVNYNNFRRKRGVVNYYLSVIYTLLKYKRKKLRVKVDNKEIEGEMFLVAAGNGQYYGGGFKILPDAEIGDGNIHVCAVTDVSKLTVLLVLPAVLLNGRHTKIKKYVKIHKAKHVSIESAYEKLALNIDGEILGAFNEIEYEMTGEQIDIVY